MRTNIFVDQHIWDVQIEHIQRNVELWNEINMTEFRMGYRLRLFSLSVSASSALA